MTPGLLQPFPSLSYYNDWDGKNFQFNDPLWYVDIWSNLWCVPKGGTTDGPSIPSDLEGAISPFGRGIYAASNFHDNGYRKTLCRLNQTTMKMELVDLTEDECNALLKEIMTVCGESSLKIELVFKAVMWFGKSSYESDRKTIWPAIEIPTELPATYLSMLAQPIQS